MFFNSSVINMLMIWGCFSIMTFDRYEALSHEAIIAGICFFGLAIVYALWFWLRKPAVIPVCSWLSDVSGAYILLFMAFAAVKSLFSWGYWFAFAAALIVSCVYLIKGPDHK